MATKKIAGARPPAPSLFDALPPAAATVERWRPTHLSPFYEVSDMGRFRSWKIDGRWGAGRRAATPRYLTGNVQHRGHICMTLSVDGRLRYVHLHRLVMEAFVGPMPEGKQVRHLNGIPSDNRLANLTYGTPKENGQDTIHHRRHGAGSVRPEGVTYEPTP